MPTAAYWGSLFGLALAGGAAQVVHGGPLLRRRMLRLGRLELAGTVVALLALGFHPLRSGVPPGRGGQRAVSACRHIWWP
jgi:hypothetical protein